MRVRNTEKVYFPYMKRPTFFIAGAPRCGTTALYTYLSAHPNIFLPKIKELHYFASDFPDLHKIVFKSLDDYLKLFAETSDRHLAVGEVSPLYIYSKVALENIKKFDPSAKIILILRNPVDFVPSIHQLNLNLLRENEQDLVKAWELQELRRQGKMIPQGCRAPELVLYGELGLFGKHLERVFQTFSREQVLATLFDDFATHPKGVYDSILSFLGVPSDNREEFPQINAGYEQRSKLLAGLIHPPRPIYRLFMKAISLLGTGFMEQISVVYNKVEVFNTRRASRSPIDPVFRAKLRAYFKDDIRKLSSLISRDLSAWLVED